MNLDYQKISYLPNVLRGSLFLYVIALLTSMAGMEIFGWLTAICSLILIASNLNRISLISKSLPLRIIDLSLLLLLVVTILGSVLNAPDEANKIDVIGRARWILLYWFLLVAFAMGFSERWRKSLLYVIAFIVVVVGCYAVFQFYTGTDLLRPGKELGSAVERGIRIVVRWRAVGLYSMSMTFGGAFGLVFAVSFGLVLVVKRYSRQFWFFSTISFFAFLGAFLSYQRGVWLALAVTLVCLLMLRLRGIVRVAVIGILVVTTLTMYLSVSGFQRRVDSIFEFQSASQQERLILWRANFEIFKDYPFIGIGYGENENVIAPFLAKIGEDKSFRGHAHNNFIQFLSGTGGLGFLAYVVFSIMNLWLCWKGYKEGEEKSLIKGYFLGVFGAQLIIHIGGLTECSFKDAEVNHQYIFHLALARVLYSKQKKGSLKGLK